MHNIHVNFCSPVHPETILLFLQHSSVCGSLHSLPVCVAPCTCRLRVQLPAPAACMCGFLLPPPVCAALCTRRLCARLPAPAVCVCGVLLPLPVCEALCTRPLCVCHPAPATCVCGSLHPLPVCAAPYTHRRHPATTIYGSWLYAHLPSSFFYQ